MPELLLHHYPASVYAEKVRLALGLKLGSAPWGSVEVGPILPRPHLLPMTGGYRRIPVLQVGADVYCDSRVVLDELDRRVPTPPLRPAAHAAAVEAGEVFSDALLFRLFVSLCFEPSAVAETMKDMDGAAVEAFRKDRAELSRGGQGLQPWSPAAARAALAQVLGEMERRLASSDWLVADAPTAADLGAYHPLWAMARNAAVAELLSPYEAVRAWMDRLAATGHGCPEPVAPEDALARCGARDPEVRDDLAPHCDGFRAGDPVTVTPVDYGLVPVAGALVGATARRVVIEREDPQAGRVRCHFPRAGFEVRSA